MVNCLIGSLANRGEAQSRSERFQCQRLRKGAFRRGKRLTSTDSGRPFPLIAFWTAPALSQHPHRLALELFPTGLSLVGHVPDSGSQPARLWPPETESAPTNDRDQLAPRCMSVPCATPIQSGRIVTSMARKTPARIVESSSVRVPSVIGAETLRRLGAKEIPPPKTTGEPNNPTTP
jgi:hypothetical protein